MSDVDDVTVEGMAERVRKLAARELANLEELKVLPEDGLDRLAKIALVLQRVRPAQGGQSPEAQGLSDEQVRKKASVA